MTRVLRNPNTAVFACLIALVVLLLLPAGSDVASAKKPPKPTPTPTPSPGPATPEIVYMSETLSKNKRNVTFKIMLMDSDGSHKTTVLDCGESYCADPTFSADGSKIIFVSEAFAPYQAIYIMDLDGSNVRELVELHESSGQPEMSPVPIGGQYWILYSDYGPYEDIYAVNEAGDTPIQVTSTPTYTQRAPAFSADGLFFSAEVFPHLKPWEGHVFHFELDHAEGFPFVTWEAATVYALPCYQAHASWSPIVGDYKFMVNCTSYGTYLYDFGPLPWTFDRWCDPDPYFDGWCRDHIFPPNWPDDPLNLNEYGMNAEFSTDALQYVYENSNTIFKANIDKSSPHTPIAEGDRWTSVYAPDWRPEPAGFLGKLTASDAAEGDGFGGATMSGDTMLIGAWADDNSEGADDAGSVYVFTRSGDAWIEQQKLNASDAEAGDGFGSFPLLSGDTAVISAPGDDHPGFVDAGSVYVFTRGAEGTWTEHQTLTASDPTDYPAFGSSLAISGDTLVVGTCDWASDDPDEGSAHVFTRTDGTWSLEQVLTAHDGERGDIFGCDVAISGDMVAVSAVWDDHPDQGFINSGSVYIFTRTGGVWTEGQKLIPSDASGFTVFGTSTIIHDDTMMIAANYDDHSGFIDAGSVYVFTRDEDGTWAEQQKLTADDPGRDDLFGTTIALTAQIAVISSPKDDHSGMSDAGSVYIFSHSEETWTFDKKITASDADGGDRFGFGAPILGDIVLMAAFLDDHSGLVDAGSVYVYRLIDE